MLAAQPPVLIPWHRVADVAELVAGYVAEDSVDQCALRGVNATLHDAMGAVAGARFLLTAPVLHEALADEGHFAGCDLEAHEEEPVADALKALVPVLQSTAALAPVLLALLFGSDEARRRTTRLLVPFPSLDGDDEAWCSACGTANLRLLMRLLREASRYAPALRAVALTGRYACEYADSGHHVLPLLAATSEAFASSRVAHLKAADLRFAAHGDLDALAAFTGLRSLALSVDTDPLFIPGAFPLAFARLERLDLTVHVTWSRADYPKLVATASRDVTGSLLRHCPRLRHLELTITGNEACGAIAAAEVIAAAAPDVRERFELVRLSVLGLWFESDDASSDDESQRSRASVRRTALIEANIALLRALPNVRECRVGDWPLAGDRPPFRPGEIFPTVEALRVAVVGVEGPSEAYFDSLFAAFPALRSVKIISGVGSPTLAATLARHCPELRSVAVQSLAPQPGATAYLNALADAYGAQLEHVSVRDLIEIAFDDECVTVAPALRRLPGLHELAPMFVSHVLSRVARAHEGQDESSDDGCQLKHGESESWDLMGPGPFPLLRSLVIPRDWRDTPAQVKLRRFRGYTREPTPLRSLELTVLRDEEAAALPEWQSALADAGVGGVTKLVLNGAPSIAHVRAAVAAMPRLTSVHVDNLAGGLFPKPAEVPKDVVLEIAAALPALRRMNVPGSYKHSLDAASLCPVLE